MNVLPRPTTSGNAIPRTTLALLVCIAAYGCAKPTPKVENGKEIALVYQAKTIEGEMVDSSPDTGPIVFVVGAGKLQPKVEAKLLGIQLGDERTFVVEDAYGQYDPLKTGKLPLSALPDEAKVGDDVQMVDGMLSRIKEIQSNMAVLDLNHPLAGKEIVFTVKVVDVREPEPDEAG